MAFRFQIIGDTDLWPSAAFGSWTATLNDNNGFADWTGDNPDDWTVLNEDGTNTVSENSGAARFITDTGSVALGIKQTSKLAHGTQQVLEYKITDSNVEGIFNSDGYFELAGSSTAYPLTSPWQFQADAGYHTVGITNFMAYSDLLFQRVGSGTALNVSFDSLTLRANDGPQASGWTSGTIHESQGTVTTGDFIRTAYFTQGDGAGFASSYLDTGTSSTAESSTPTHAWMTYDTGLSEGDYFLRYTVTDSNPLVESNNKAWRIIGHNGVVTELSGEIGQHSAQFHLPPSGDIEIRTNDLGNFANSGFQLYVNSGYAEVPNPSYGNSESLSLNQVAGESTGGEFYVFDRGSKRESLRLSWNNLNRTHMEGLLGFFETVAKGMKNTFDIEFDDWRPTEFGGTGGNITHTDVRFGQPRIDFSETRNGLYSVSTEIRI